MLPNYPSHLTPMKGTHRTYIVNKESGKVEYVEIDVISFFESISILNPVLSRKKIVEFEVVKTKDISKYPSSGLIVTGVDYLGVLKWKGISKTFVVKNDELFIYRGVLLRAFNNEFFCKTKEEQFAEDYPRGIE